MAITPLPTPPQRSDPTNFAVRGDAFLAALPAFADEANAQAAALTLNSTNDASASSVLIGTGAKTFTVSSGKSYQPGMYLVIADAAAPSTNSMWGQVTSYSSTTLVMNIMSVRGSGTKTAWLISQSAPGGASLDGSGKVVETANLADFATVAGSCSGNSATATLATTATIANTVDAAGLNSKIQPIAASVAASALTITLNPTALDFRNSSLTAGTVNQRTISSAISLVVPSTATLGTENAVQNSLAVIAIDNAGTVELAVVNIAGGNDLSETGVISTTALSTGSDSNNVIYSTTARTSLPYRVVGYVESTQATAGTWDTAPSKIQGAGGLSMSSIIKSGPTIATAQATTSGTSIDFTNIPNWVKRITVMFHEVSTNGVSPICIRLGDSGGIETTGYAGFVAPNGAMSVGFTIYTSWTAATVVSGSASFALLNPASNVFSGVGHFGFTSGAALAQFSGSKALSSTIDRIRITTVNGTDTFDGGSINIMYE